MIQRVSINSWRVAIRFRNTRQKVFELLTSAVLGTREEATRESFHMKAILEVYGKEIWRQARNDSADKRQTIMSSHSYLECLTNLLESEILSFKVIDATTIATFTDIELARCLRDHCDWTTTLERVIWNGDPVAKSLVWRPPGFDPRWDTSSNRTAGYEGIRAVRYYIQKGELIVDCRSKLVEWRSIILSEMTKLEDPVIAILKK